MASGPPQREAAGYYYQQPPPQQQYYNDGPYQQQPPPYPNQEPPAPSQGQNYSGQNGVNEKPSFNQAFKVGRPKWNDLWAGLLVCVMRLLLTSARWQHTQLLMIITSPQFLAVVAGFAVVSGISINGYCAYLHQRCRHCCSYGNVPVADCASQLLHEP